MKVEDYIDLSPMETFASVLKDSDKLRFTLYSIRTMVSQGFWFYLETAARRVASLYPDEKVALDVFKATVAELTPKFLSDAIAVTAVIDRVPRALVELYAFIDTCQELSVDPRVLRSPESFLEQYAVDQKDLMELVRGQPSAQQPFTKTQAAMVQKYFNGVIADVQAYEQERNNASLSN